MKSMTPIALFKKFLSLQFIASVEVSNMVRCSSKRNAGKGPLWVDFHIFSFDIFQQVYVQAIDLCTFRSEIIHISPKIRFCIAVYIYTH